MIFMKRYDYVDVLKAFAIFLVVFAHAPLCDNALKQFIYSFHMPVFFFVYGLTYNLSSHENKGFLTKLFVFGKLKRLIIPAAFWSLFYAALNGIKQGSFSIKSFLYILYGSQYGFKAADSLTSIWFLPCMFAAVCFTEIIMCFVNSLKCKNPYKYFTIMVFAFVLSMISYFLPHIKIGYPWCVNVAPMACAFILFGYFFKVITRKYVKFYSGVNLLFFTVFTFVFLFFTFKLNLKYIQINNVDMASSEYGNYFLYIMDAMLGTVMLTSFSAFVTKMRLNISPLIALGKSTMPIFLLHKPIIQKLCHICNAAFPQADNFLVVTAISFVTVIISYGLTIIIRYTVPVIIGERKTK